MYEEEIDEQALRARRRGRVIYPLVVALGLLALGGLVYWYSQTIGLSSDGRFDREVTEDRSMAIAMGPLVKKYPYEYHKLREAAVLAYNLEKVGKVSAHMPERFISRFIKRHSGEALQGGDKQSLAFLDALTAMWNSAVQDKALCHALVGNEDQDSDTDLMLGKEPYARMVAAFVELAASGRDHPAVRQPLTPAQLQAFMKQGRDLARSAHHEKDDVEAARCKEEAEFLNSVAKLPPDQRILYSSFELRWMS